MSKDERKGFLTPDQEEKLDKLIVLKGIGEAVDGPAIRILDNQGLERLKGKLNEISPEALLVTYAVVDSIFAVLPDVVK